MDYSVSGITRIKIEGFRRLRSVEVEMSPFMVLTGANGSGKTSFLDALSVISASASGKLSEKLSEMGGLLSILTRGKTDKLSITIDMDVPGHSPLSYHVSITSRGAGYSITDETLSQVKNENTYSAPFYHIFSKGGNVKYSSPGTGNFKTPNWNCNPNETALSQIPKMYRQSESFRRVLATAGQYHSIDAGTNSPVKMPQMLKPSVLPGKNGEELLSLLFTLKENDKERFSAITDSLKAEFPGFEELSFPPVAAGMLAMTWKDRNFPAALLANELSEGTLRFLWLVALLQSPGLPAVTMIDEPENSLHPALLAMLSQLMRDASSHSQIIAATHSDRFIRFLKPEEVYVVDIDDEGGTSITRADTINFGEWLKNYSLD